MLKSESQKNIVLVACISLAIFLIGFLLFEIREIPNVKWRYSLDYNDKEPYGLYVFKENLNRYFNVNQSIYQIYSDTSSTDGLYIHMDDTPFSSATIDTLIEISKKGNDILLVSSYFPQQLDSVNYDYIAREYQYSDELRFKFKPKSGSDNKEYKYQFFNQEFDLKDSTGYNLFEIDSLAGENRIITTANDSLALMVKYSFESGNIYYHAMPELFVNSSYRQDDIFQYTEDVFSLFDPKFIVLLKNVNGVTRESNSHPLEYIMSSPPLKWAYYLLVITLFLYAIFGSKRKQKAIPIEEKNENTSLEYIETVSQLFYQQDKHEKLVAHMRDVFYYRMEKKYFVNRDHPTYLETLSKKSRIPEKELSFVLDRFKNLEDKYSFESDQLITLHNRIEAIYKLLDNPKKK